MDVRHRFQEVVKRPDESVDLAEAALLIAGQEYPELDVDAYLARLDEMGARLGQRVRDNSQPIASVLGQFLFAEQGFKGNEENYYDPRNSFLNDVLDRRTGIPITLSTVCIEVARRAGLSVAGVGLPGHFIIQVDGSEGHTLIDPFYGGTEMTEADCQERLNRLYGGRVKVDPSMLFPVDRKHILARTLRNLKAIYMKASDHSRALRTTNLLLDLNPYSGEDLRDRGLLYAAMDCYEFAVRDLESYISLVPQAPEAGRVAALAKEMRTRSTRIN